ncbi:type IV conjugative transfer system protein TraL (plasmid) [Legionella lytica]|uniref:Type IV conjugative transfer system protein TraL n=1 Tax=Legionella lytica TaxID=96232 RepID=A0ABY4YD69_9GAMM|nr:type IV conjugative transfer system protein TraL [Legionella lytica]USQ15570.1 type IV conjugative transfer system protein TraL [Legionella lytica]
MNPMHHPFLNHIDAPKRYLTLTLDELVVAGISLLLFAFLSQRILVSILGFSLVSGLRAIKKGQGPKALLVLAYWYLPHAITQFFLPRLPKSYYRVWVA